MHLAIDAVGAKSGGAATVLSDVLSAALRNGRISRLSVFCSPARDLQFELPQADKLEIIQNIAAGKSKFSHGWWLVRGLSNHTKTIGANALLCLCNCGIPPRNVPGTLLVQQSLPFCRDALETLPFQRQFELHAIKRLMELSCKKCRQIIVQTETMKSWICDTFGIADQKISVIMPSAPRLPAEVPDALVNPMRATPPDERLLYVGSDDPHKNLSVVIRSLQEIRLKRPNVTLFMTLPPQHEYSRIHGVVCLGYLRGGSLRQAYELATLLLMPSLVETVGLPLLEAAALGTPVMVADRPYGHDVCRNTAEFFDPLSAGELASKTLALLNDPNRRSELANRARLLIESRAEMRPYEQLINLALQDVHGAAKCQ
jgi:glycosyltransferase involved in cell wall biosynthesis